MFKKKISPEKIGNKSMKSLLNEIDEAQKKLDEDEIKYTKIEKKKDAKHSLKKIIPKYELFEETQTSKVFKSSENEETIIIKKIKTKEKRINKTTDFSKYYLKKLIEKKERNKTLEKYRKK